MQKAIVVVTTSLIAGVLIVFGCSAPSPEGSNLAGGKNNGGKSSGTSGDNGDNNTSSGSSGTSSGSSGAATGNCSAHEKVSDTPACDSCTKTKCCDAILECDKASDCKAATKCADDCKGEETCLLTCITAHDKGFTLLQEVASCAQDKCAAECPAAETPDAGDLGDVL